MTSKKSQRIKAVVPPPQGERAGKRIKAGSPEARDALSPSPEAPSVEAEKPKKKS
jgi:hypothetical protein